MSDPSPPSPGSPIPTLPTTPPVDPHATNYGPAPASTGTIPTGKVAILRDSPGESLHLQPGPTDQRSVQPRLPLLVREPQRRGPLRYSERGTRLRMGRPTRSPCAS